MPAIRKGKKLQLGDSMTTLDRVIIFSSEFSATAILLFLGCAGCINFTGNPETGPTHLQICLTFGLAVMVGVQCFGHISGSHMNPMISLASFLMGNISLIQLPVYCVAQFLGALTGFGLIKLVTPSEVLVRNGTAPGLCSPGLGPHVSEVQGLFAEFILSFVLILVCCSVWDSRNNNKHDSLAVRFGFAIAVLALAGGPYTGANMNPARSFAPALFNGDWQYHWLYWVGPFMAGGLGAGFYRLLFTKDDEQTTGPEGIPLNEKA